MKKTFIYFLFSTLWGQFGQNIVQYENFDWNYIQSKHFDIYYYEKGRKHAEFTAKEAEIAYLKIADRLNWSLKNRVSIIIYNSHNDFQQTNVIDSYMFEGIGGVTELYKNRIVIPYDGSHQQFKHVIHHELVHAFINDCVYGGNLRNMINNAVEVVIPMWMNEGLAEFLSSGWDANSEMWIRDLAINASELPDFSQLTGYMAYRGGQSVWNFITDKWGEESIAEIFYQIKKEGKLDLGVKKALGLDLKNLNKKWHQYLKEQYWPDIVNRNDIREIARQLTDHEKLNNSYNIAPAISPDGSKIAIFSNKSGPMALYFISAEDGKFIKKVIQGERNAEYEELHILKPGITWSPNSKKIAFSAKSGKSDALFIIDLISEKKQKFRLEMEGIFRPVWHPEEDKIAFIGNNGITSDIYLFNIKTERLINLTNDWYTDDQVTWAPDGKSIVFVSDRRDQIQINTNSIPLEHNINQTDIYRLFFDSLDPKGDDNIKCEIIRLTDTPFNETYPTISNNGIKLAYISDQSGINNIYLKDLNSDSTTAITNIITGITQLSWNGDDTQLIFTGFYKSGYDIYTLANPLKLINDSIVAHDADWLNKTKNELLRKNESNNQEPNFDKYKNYIFSNLNNDSNNNNKTDLLELDENKQKDSSGVFLTHNYKTRFTLDLAQAYYSFDSRYGGQGMAYFLFSDILGDHKIYLGTEMEVDLKRSDYFLFYRFLPYKIDWNLTLYHLAYQYIYDYNINMFPSYLLFQNLGTTISASKPFNRFNRLDFGVDINHLIESKSNPSDIDILYNEIIYEDTTIESFSTLIPSIKYIWDNTLWSFTYPNKGTRYYIDYKFSPGINKRMLTFHKLTSDIRNYFNIGEGISIGTKIFIGTSWGENAQKFRLGGVPSVTSSNNEERIYYTNNLSIDELYFSEYVMPLRGSSISKKMGRNVLLGNIELRLPFLIYYFPAIKFLGQINGVIFTDVGVAWDDQYPQLIHKDNWNSSNQGWLMSYGLGPRFIFLGMPWQLDFAWEFNPHIGTISERKWYLSIGLDY